MGSVAVPDRLSFTDERARLAVELRAQLGSWRAVADHFGVHLNTVYLWRSEKARERASARYQDEDYRRQRRERTLLLREATPDEVERWADATWSSLTEHERRCVSLWAADDSVLHSG